jgi:glutamyl-tRNA synthetase
LTETPATAAVPPARPLVGRLAPSPTGGLHLGHARTFLIAWLAARAAGGRIVLRIEDLDASRVRAEARAGAIEDLRWLGLDWDEGPFVQSERLETYATALERLKRAEAVYPCTCTRSDIARAAGAPHAEEEGPVYPGTCAGRSAGEAEALIRAGRPFAWRFRVPDATVSWDDLFQGPNALNPAALGGDFPVARDPVGPSYQLAVVCDDAAMGITQVVRGDDLVASTPRQMLLYRALGHEPPAFGHVPLAVDAQGRRLAKRAGSIKLATLRAAGVEPRRLVGWLAQSCGWAGADPDDARPSTPHDWIGRFRLDSVPARPWVVTEEGLAGLL